MSARPEGPRPTEGVSKTTIHTLRDKRRRGEAISMVTAYDFPTARAAEEAGIDAILVGDSLAMVVLGHPNTLTVTMDEMLHHARAVARGAQRPLLVGDMPFLSYQADAAEAVRNAGHFLQAGMDAVKLEGGREYAVTAAAIVRAGIPVQGHIGLTPQSVHALGGYKVQGKTAESARELLDDALALEDAGCSSLVLESLPDRLATAITERLTIPTIGIGAGPGTSGQVLVAHDLLGMFDRFTPRFVKRYAELGAAMREAFAAYKKDVDAHAFPGPEHSYTMTDEEWKAFQAGTVKRPHLRAARS
jgi:3-methyl-2-oxobutanoate hydroxymethyltransferase